VKGDNTEMNYKIIDKEELILISSDGNTRDEALEKLNGYLSETGIESQGYYYFEAYDRNGVAGAMAFASVNKMPESNRDFQAQKISKGKYFVFDYPYGQWVERNKPGVEDEMDISEYLEKENLSLSGLPFFEFLEDKETDTIRVYVPV